jgi:hypothetical protein
MWFDRSLDLLLVTATWTFLSNITEPVIVTVVYLIWLIYTACLHYISTCLYCIYFQATINLFFLGIVKPVFFLQHRTKKSGNQPLFAERLYVGKIAIWFLSLLLCMVAKNTGSQSTSSLYNVNPKCMVVFNVFIYFRHKNLATKCKQSCMKLITVCHN